MDLNKENEMVKHAMTLPRKESSQYIIDICIKTRLNDCMPRYLHSLIKRRLDLVKYWQANR